MNGKLWALKILYVSGALYYHYVKFKLRCRKRVKLGWPADYLLLRGKIEAIMENSEDGAAQRARMYVGCGSDVGGMREHLFE